MGVIGSLLVVTGHLSERCAEKHCCLIALNIIRVGVSRLACKSQ